MKYMRWNCTMLHLTTPISKTNEINLRIQIIFAKMVLFQEHLMDRNLHVSHPIWNHSSQRKDCHLLKKLITLVDGWNILIKHSSQDTIIKGSMLIISPLVEPQLLKRMLLVRGSLETKIHLWQICYKSAGKENCVSTEATTDNMISKERKTC